MVKHSAAKRSRRDSAEDVEKIATPSDEKRKAHQKRRSARRGGGAEEVSGGHEGDLKEREVRPAEGEGLVAAAVPDEDETPIEEIFEIADTLAATRGTFASRVFRVVAAIPKGKVFSYGQCAALAGAPRNARQVGKMLGEGLACGVAPWQRVISAAGTISLPMNYGGARQRKLLEEEGVVFLPSGRVASGTFWEPSEEDRTCLQND